MFVIKRIIVVIGCLLLLVPNLWSQQNALTAPQGNILPQVEPKEVLEPEPTEPGPTEPESEPQSADEPLSSLLINTLPDDIRTSTFYELAAWLQQLSLSTRGGRQELEQRLFEYFDLRYDSSPSVEQDPVRNDVEIIIDSAIASEYYTIEQIDEQYVRLSGGVQLILRDNEATHTIIADELIFNQSENNVTATGNINYTLERGNQTEQFNGRTLTMNLNTWDGVFLRGISLRPSIPTPNTQSRDVDLYFTGDVITRSPDDVIVLENGTVTSSPISPPYYSIRASKIWLLSPTDWGMQDATLYIGTIPLFYFPYFFNPGDELVFHPSIGFRMREGAYIQTTTYLLGRAPPQDTGISFLQLTQNPDQPKELRGLFLRSITDAPVDDAANSSNTLRILGDFYTRLGGYIGLEGMFTNLSFLNTLEFSVGIGLTQNIYRVGDSFTSYTVEDGEIVSGINRTNFLGLDVPFRYLLNLTTQMTIPEITTNIQLDFALYSDPYLSGDFSQRAESINWLELIEGNQQSVDQTTNSTGDRTSFAWRFSSRISPSVSELSPFVNRLSVDNLIFSLNWLSRDVASSQLSAAILQADRSPQRRFFFPDEATFPNLDLSISGTLLNPSLLAALDQGDAVSRESIERGASDLPLQPPWETREPQPEQEAVDHTIRVPGLAGALREQRNVNRGIDYSLTYRLDPQLNLQGFFNDEEWEQPSDVNFDLQYSALTLVNDLNIGYNINFLNRLFVFDGDIQFDTRYRTIVDDELLDEETRDTLETQAQRSTGITLEHNLTFRSFPLEDIDILRGTNLRYTLNLLLYEYLFTADENNGLLEERFQDRFIAWDEEWVNSHQLGFDLRLQLLDATQSLAVSVVLPPRDAIITANLSLITGPLTSTVSTTIRQADEMDNTNDEWIFDPLTLTETLTIIPEIRLTERLVIDIEEGRVASSTTNLRLWFLNVDFVARQSPSYDFVVSAGGGDPWVARDDEALRPISASISLNPTYTSEPLWNNRINISLGVNLGLTLDLLRYNRSAFTMRPQITFSIWQFVDITFQASIRNDFIYQYIPELAERLGREPRNLFTDLAESFNIFDRDALERTFFNLESINFIIRHDLIDWDFTFTYSGRPELNETGSARREYIWEQSIVFALTWKLAPEFDNTIRIEDDEVTFDEN